ncbi:MAG: hypothetical protein HRT44_00790 [Bdellovibrionales bacterium]|nr:hypothetical protein [Bdellovibrionales bacterium]
MNKIIKFNLIFISILFLACTPSRQTPLGSPNENGINVEYSHIDPPVATPESITAEGSGQGREGGHYLICSRQLPLPYKGCTPNRKLSCEQQKVFFIDYFLTVGSQQDYDALSKFIGDESSEVRLDMVVKRIILLFRDFPSMSDKLNFAIDFSEGFMEGKGAARWIEDVRSPVEIEVTSDLAPSNLPQTKRELVEEYCRGRFFQAAVYDYSVSEDEVFEYSRYFENSASEMQKSFRNIHELLRFVLKSGETRQIQVLTYYMHTHEFLSGDPVRVRAKLHELSDATAAENRFF